MNIRVDFNAPIYDGTELVFRSPEDCSKVTGLIVYYPDNGGTASREFAFADAHGENVGSIDYLSVFGKGAVVKVILDLDTNMAFIQNPDTNAYLESRFAELEGKIGTGSTTNHFKTGDEVDMLATAGELIPGDTYTITESTDDGYFKKGDIWYAESANNPVFQMNIIGDPGKPGKDGASIHSITGKDLDRLAVDGKLVVGDTYFVVSDFLEGELINSYKGTLWEATENNRAEVQGWIKYELTGADKEEIASMVGTKIVPDYIVAEAERVAKAVQATRTAKSIVFPVMTDMHLFAGNSAHDNSLISAQYAGMGVAELKKRIHLDFVGYLGDYTWAASDCTAEQVMKDITAFKETTDTSNTEIWCVGNHDLNYGKNRDRVLTTDELYSHIGVNADGVKPYADIERGYGYVDFENQKVRVIYLNTCDASDYTPQTGVNATSEWISPTQIQWLADTALNFTDKTAPSEWGIVVISHHPLHYGVGCFNHTMKLLEAYKDGTSGSLSCTICVEYAEDGTKTYPQQVVSYDFTNVERAEIICNIHGHNHNCGYSKISSTTSNGTEDVKPWLWRFCIPNICANRYNESATSTNETFKALYGEFDGDGNPVYWTKETGTAKATSFCVVNIDRKNKKIYAHIFGAGKDRVIDLIEPAFTNQIPISTDTSGAIYNGKGWKENTYLSNGNEGSRTGVVTTGFIPVGFGSAPATVGEQVIYLSGAEVTVGGDVRISFYDANKSHIGTKASNVWITTAPTVAEICYTLGDDGYINMIDVSAVTGYLKSNDSKEAAYFRICAPGIDGDSIITVNEPIV